MQLYTRLAVGACLLLARVVVRTNGCKRTNVGFVHKEQRQHTKAEVVHKCSFTPVLRLEPVYCLQVRLCFLCVCLCARGVLRRKHPMLM